MNRFITNVTSMVLKLLHGWFFDFQQNVIVLMNYDRSYEHHTRHKKRLQGYVRVTKRFRERAINAHSFYNIPSMPTICLVSLHLDRPWLSNMNYLVEYIFDFRDDRIIP